MASTNKTTNYELSQFVGTDKPAWLTDYNGDMGKIDTGIYNAQSTATGADGKADTNATNIGNMANLTTTDKTSLVGAVSEVDSHADTAQSTADTASTIATTANSMSNSLKNYINVQGNGNKSVSVSNGTISGDTEVSSAKNSDGSLGKVYGYIRVNNPNTNNKVTVTIADTGLRPANDINIKGLVIKSVYTGGGSFSYSSAEACTIHTDGTVTITFESSTVVSRVDLQIPPCLLFMADFGD